MTLAVCHVAWLGDPTRFEAGAVLGADRAWHERGPLVLFPAFEAFYETLLDDLDGRKAVKELLEAASARNSTHSLSVIYGERVFTQAFRRYVEEKCSPAAIEQRVARHIAEGKPRAAAQGAAVPEAMWAELAAEIARRMGDMRPKLRITGGGSS